MNAFTFCWKHRLISKISNTFIIDETNDVNRSAKVEQLLKGNRNIDDKIYSPGKVVIFSSHWNSENETNKLILN